LKNTIGETDILLVVANDPVARLPLSLLPTAAPDSLLPSRTNSRLLFDEYRDVDWLAKNHAVAVVPSVSAFVQLRSLPRNTDDVLLYAGFGDPWFSDSTAGQEKTAAGRESVYRRERPSFRHATSADLAFLPRLPDTAAEVRRIAAMLGVDVEQSVFTGKRATESQVKGMDLSRHDILVFATHGLGAGDLDGLDQPGLALSSPAITGEPASDGILTMGEIMWLRLDADWVVLSACNTAADDGRGSEALSGLGQAFFYAGARSLLLTSWPVETISAMALTTSLFAIQAQNPRTCRAEALRNAKLALLDEAGGDGFSYAHPFFWAPFIIAGDGGQPPD
jgi:CHAT domain-containing protein